MAVFFTASFTFAQQGPSNLNISGGLFQPNGTPITNASVNFKIEVYDKTGTCLLYSENHLGQDLSNTKGGFALELGKGSSVNNAIDLSTPTLMTSKVFENSGAVTGGWPGCPSGANLGPGDNRLIRVQYDLGAGYQTMNPDVPIGAAAYSIVAETLQGKRPSDFIQVHDDVTNKLNQANVENVFSSTNYPKLDALLNGSSTQYMPGTPTTAINFNAQRLTNVGAPTSANDAATKNYADTNIGGKTADLSGVGPATGDGYTLIWDKAAQKWATGVPSAVDNSKLPLAGGTMSGAITMGGFDILGTGHITMSPLKTLTLGTFTSAQESALVATLTPANAGASWYNSTNKTFNIWNGTAAITQMYNGSTAGGDLTGTYPNPTIGNDKITSAKVDSAGIGINRLVISDPTTGASLKFATCATNEVLRYEGVNGWTCRDPSSIVTFPVTKVNGKTGNITLNANDLGLGTAALQNVGTGAGDVPQLDGTGKIPAALLPAGTGTITQVTAGTGLTGGGSSGNVTLNLADTAVIAGSYGAANKVATFTVDQQGRLTAAGQTNISIGDANITDVAGSKVTGNISGNAAGFTGNLAGDVTGSQSTTVVGKIQGRTVANTAPNPNEVLMWNNTNSQWEPAAVPSAPVSSVAGRTGAVVLDYADINNGAGKYLTYKPNNTACGTNEVLKWDGAKWICAADNDTAGGAAGGDLTGTYPNPTIANNAVTTSKISDGAVTDAKIVGVAGSKITGNISGNAAGFTGNLTGDVTGTQSATTVGKIQGRAVANAAPNANEVLMWNNTNSQWEPTAVPSAPVSSVAGRTGAVTLDWGDVNNAAGKYMTYKPNNTACATNELLKFDGANWVCTSVSGALGTSYIVDGGNTRGAAISIGTNDNFGLGFRTNGTNKMVIDTTGNVGIGTTAPSFALDVNGVINSWNYVTAPTLYASASGATVYPSVIAQAYTTSGVPQFVLSRAGGTSASPGAVANFDALGALKAQAYNGSQVEDAANVGFSVDGTNVSGSGNHTGGRIDFSVRGTSSAQYSTPLIALSIRNSGNVGIGTTNPARLLHVNGPMRITPAALPGTPAAGDLAFDSGSGNALKFYDGSVWQTVGTGTGSGDFLRNGSLAMTGALDMGSQNITAVGTSIAASGALGISQNAGSALTLGNATGASSATVQSGTGGTTITSSGTTATAVNITATGTNGGITLAPNGTGVVTSTTPVKITPAALPAAPTAGTIAFDSGALNALKFYNGSTWTTVGNGTGDFMKDGSVAMTGDFNANSHNLNNVNNISGSAAMNLTQGNGMSLTIGNTAASSSTSINGPTVNVGGAGTTSLSVGSLATGTQTTYVGSTSAASQTNLQSGTGGTAVSSSGQMTISSSKVGAGAVTVSSTGGTTATALITSNGTGADSVNIMSSGTNGGITLAPNGTGVVTSTGAVRVTPTALPPSPAAGTIAMDSATGNAMKYYDGTAWQTLGTGTGSGDFLRNGSLSMTGNFNAGGNSILGNTTSGANLTLESTSHATKGFVNIQPNGGSVGIGTTSPSDLLTVRKDQSTTTQINVVNGGTGAPQFTATNDGGRSVSMGIYSSASAAYGAISANGPYLYSASSAGFTVMSDNASGVIKFASGGNSEKVRIDASGNVGIGTTSPARLLHVNGPMRITPAALPGTPAAGDLAFDSGAANALKFYDGSTWQTVGTGTGSGDFMKDGSVAMTGNLTGPSTFSVLQTAGGTLNVGDSTSTSGVNVRSGTGGIYLSNGATGSLTLGYSGGTGMIDVTGSGPVIIESAKTAAGAVTVKSTGGGASSTTLITSNGTGSSSVNITSTGTNGGITLAANGTGSVNIQPSGGNVGVGTSTPLYPLSVYNTSSSTGIFSSTSNGIAVYGTSSGGAGNAFYGSGTGGANGGYFTASGGGNALIAYGGNVGVGTTSPARLLHVNGPMRITPAALPGTPAAGDLAFDSGAANALKFYDGSVWQTVGTGTGSGDFMKNGSVAMTGNFNAGGNSILGNTTSGANLTLESTSHATKGNVIIQPNDGNVGIGSSSPAARLVVKGAGASSATTNILVTDSANGPLFNMHDDGAVGFGIGAGSLWAFDVSSSSTPYSSNVGMANFVTVDAMAQDKGATIALGGYDGSTFNRMWAAVGGLKENATSGNYAGYFSIATRANGGSLTEKMRVSSAGNVGIGTNAPARLLHVNGAARFTPTTTPAAPAAGDMFFDSTASNALKFYDGSAWQTVGTGTGSGDFMKNGSVAMTGNFNAGGNSILGNTTSGANLTLESTSHATKGNVVIQPTAGNVGIGTATPAYNFDVYTGTNGIQLQQGSGTRIMRIDSQGMSFNTVATFGQNNWGAIAMIENYNNVTSPTRVGYLFKGVASQSGDAYQYLNSSGTKLAAINSAGGGYFAGSVGVGTASPVSDLQVTSASNPTLTVGPSSATNANAMINLIGKSGGTQNLAAIWADWGGSLSFQPATNGAYFFKDGSSTTRMLIDNTGNVGIGTTSPARLLHVNGPMRITPAALPTSPAAGELAFDSGAANALKFYDGSAWQTVGTGTGSGDFMKDGSVAMTGNFNAGGNKVLGNTTTGANLTLESTSHATKGNVLIQPNGGNVGIGTTVPTATLDVQQSTNADLVVNYANANAGKATYMNLQSTTNWVSMTLAGAGQSWVFGQNGGTAFQLADATNSKTPFIVESNAPTNSLYVKSTGVGIGTTAPGVNSFANTLTVNGGATRGMIEAMTTAADGTGVVSGQLGFFMNTNTTTKQIAAVLSVTEGATANDRGGTLQFYTKPTGGAAAERMRIDSTGKVGIGTTIPTQALDVVGNVQASTAMYSPAYYYTSDQRLKQEVRTIASPMDKVNALRGVNFTWRETGEKDVGFIAQEVEKVLPEVVKERPDAKFGSLKTVKYGNIVALTVEAIKELWNKLMNHDQRIQQLEKENLELKARLERLEKRMDERK